MSTPIDLIAQPHAHPKGGPKCPLGGSAQCLNKIGNLGDRPRDKDPLKDYDVELWLTIARMA
jgi:hypothetical protein